MSLGFSQGSLLSAGVALSWTATYGDAQDISFGSSTYTTPTVNIGTGVFVFFLYDNLGRTHTSATIGGTAATMITEDAGKGISMWYASTSVATGTMVVEGSAAYGCIGSCGGLLTGVTAVPTTFTRHDPDSVADPQQVTAVVSAGGIGIVGIGGATGDGRALPTTWASATRDAVCEAAVATGNTTAVAMAHTTTAGSQTPGATGNSGNGWGFNGSGMVMACWAP